MKYLITLLILSGLFIVQNIAQEKYSICPDVEGSKAHPLIKKYKNSCIVAYHEIKFDAVTFPISKIRNYDDLAEKEITEEGQVTNIIYGIDNSSNTTVLEIQRNYEQALKNSGLDILFSAYGKKNIGGYYDLKRAYPTFGNVKTVNNYTSLKHDYVRFSMSSHNQNINNDDALFIAKGKKENKIYTVAIFIHYNRTSWKGLANNIFIQAQIVEKEDMETGQVSIANIDEKIKNEGKEVFHNILFDFGSDNLKEESKSVIKIMAEYLNENKETKYYIVGHTDNVGKLSSNQELSTKRAKAVVHELLSIYGVKETQISAHGVGQLAPISSNKTEEGRGLNRRVELVLR